jgi:hypothetical protein
MTPYPWLNDKLFVIEERLINRFCDKELYRDFQIRYPTTSPPNRKNHTGRLKAKTGKGFSQVPFVYLNWISHVKKTHYLNIMTIGHGPGRVSTSLIHFVLFVVETVPDRPYDFFSERNTIYYRLGNY